MLSYYFVFFFLLLDLVVCLSLHILNKSYGLRHVLCCLRVCFIGLLFLCSGCFQMLFSKADRLLGFIFSLASWCNLQPGCLGFVLVSGFVGHAGLVRLSGVS